MFIWTHHICPISPLRVDNDDDSDGLSVENGGRHIKLTLYVFFVPTE